MTQSKFCPVSGAGLQIVGAGLAGMIAAHAWPRARILEAAPESSVSEHKALLRFRTDAVARLTGTEFRRVTVRKGLWAEGGSAEPSIELANQYAQKVLKTTAIPGDRSIWNLSPAERFVAPETFIGDLRAALADRISYGVSADFPAHTAAWRNGTGDPLVSTAPLPLALRGAELQTDEQFVRNSISVDRWRLPGADLFQTIYFPSPNTPVYRASFTGDLLIVETDGTKDYHLLDVIEAFGFSCCEEFTPLESVKQQYGKIRDIPANVRQQLLFRLSHEHGVYSLGRFATWRNVLLDDLVQDIDVIKRLMRTETPYDLRRSGARKVF